MVVNVKKCRVCKKEFTPRNSMQKVDSPACALRLSKLKKEKAYKDTTRQLKSAHRANDKGYLTKSAQFYCNKYIRERDKDKPCVSCGKLNDGSHQVHASHYRSRGSASQLRFHELNIHSSCMQCNSWKSGNIEGYTPELIARIGTTCYEYLKNNNTSYSYSVDDLHDIIQYYKDKYQLLSKTFSFHYRLAK